jgi:probable rRNA maturation factor
MTQLNREYRGKEGPTNVLSFSQREGEGTPERSDLLGDVVICSDVAADEAAQLGYSEAEMVLYLLIHGILHLHGYDHAEPPDAQAMQGEVDRIFQEFLVWIRLGDVNSGHSIGFHSSEIFENCRFQSGSPGWQHSFMLAKNRCISSLLDAAFMM